jgi:drug/metabolite transporter (DMT)-like permease
LRYAKARSATHYPELLSLGIVFAVSALVIAAYSMVGEQATLLVWEGRNHLIMMVTALLCQTFGWYLINRNITEIPAHEGSLLLMLQPLLATVWGCLFFSEPFDIAMLAGIILTLTGITLYQVRRA